MTPDQDKFIKRLVQSAITAAMFRLFQRMPWWLIALLLVALIGGGYILAGKSLTP